MDAADLRVVVADANPDFLEALSLWLQLDGHAVKTATNGADAFVLVADFQPICVLADVNMDGVGGVELAAHLGARYGLDITLIAITSWGEVDQRMSKEFARFDHCLRKPVELDTLRQRLPPIVGRR